jgi:S-formylglutathione hydrolase FrmB/alkylhydroperoxidase family enzyme
VSGGASPGERSAAPGRGAPAAAGPTTPAAPRIAPGSRREIGWTNFLIARALGLAAGSPPPNVFTTLARHRRLFRRWLRFAGALMPGGMLPRAETELVILRVAHNCGSEYEWRHHARIGERAGLTADEVARVRKGPSAEGWSARQLALLRAADELHERRGISDELWAQLREYYSDPELIELCMLAGHYEMLAMTLNSLGVAPDEPSGRRPSLLGRARRPRRPRRARRAGPARRARRGASTLLCLSTLVAALTLAASAAAAPSFADGQGLHVVSERSIDSRLLELTVSSPALPGPAHVRILTPAGYAAGHDRRYPVLYLLHGTSGGASDWTTMGDAEQTTAGLPLIVVMPDIALNRDGGGWCTNWWRGDANGLPEWETFHIRELIPWIDGNMRTIASRSGRAIAGLSQGGFCSMSYAARHPDVFGVALSYSGAPDVAYDPVAAVGATAVINATEVGLDGVPPNSMFGDRVTEEINWAAHDPATLAGNLRATDLYIYTGNGMPGPLDSGPPNPGAMGIEGLVAHDSDYFHRRLQSLGIPSLYDNYGPGTHTWPYWARDLRESIGGIMADFAHPRPEPDAITYTSADAGYGAYGWQVSTHRVAREFSTLEDAGARGFGLRGSGSATVLTPAYYAPGSRYAVTLSGPSRAQTLSVTAGRDGRLQLELPLGPANPFQQYTLAAALAGTRVYETRVRIRVETARQARRSRR